MDREEKATAEQFVASHHLQGSLSVGDLRLRCQEKRTLKLVHAFYYLLQLDFTHSQAKTLNCVRKRNLPRASWILSVDVLPSKRGNSQHSTISLALKGLQTFHDRSHVIEETTYNLHALC
jgi:hypothetical protein